MCPPARLRSAAKPRVAERNNAVDLEREKAIYRIINNVYAPLPELREAYLRAECGDDAALFENLRELVAADADDEEAVAHRAGASLNALIENAADHEAIQEELKSFDWCRRVYGPLEPGASVGPYRIHKKISEGGMGIVFQAGRDDDFQMKVALKLIKPAMVTEETLSRFHRERQILANLRHPNIAQLFDGGTSDAGLPYLAMEFVDGEPIDVYCRRRRLSLRRRLELFCKVCDAVSYAHQNLVIHRDIKPANILVTQDGEPKLLDFGIAGLIDAKGSRGRMRTTRPLMTPEFASPEQVRGEHLTVAGDIYSLGVILYYLLTDAMPYAFNHDRPGDYLRIIYETTPLKPSQRATKDLGDQTEVGDAGEHRRRRKLLSGDLDSIVLHALQKEPGERYPSVEQFAEDIRLHLQGMPVRVRTGTFTYRLSKFIVRNHLALSTSALFVLLLIGFTLSSLYQYRQTLLEKDQAHRVTEILMSLFEITDPSWSRGETLTAKTFLDESTVKIKAELKDQPRAYSRLTGAMGRVYLKIGLHNEALALMEDSLAGYRSVDSAPIDKIETLNDLARLLAVKGDIRRAEQLSRQALADLEQSAVGKDPLLRAKHQAELGWILTLKGAFGEAETLLQEALRVQREFAPETAELAAMLGYLGRLYLAQGAVTEAQQPLYESLALRSRILGGTHPQLAEILHDLSMLMAQSGDFRAAKRMSREALVMRRRLFGDQHYQVAANLVDLAAIFVAAGEGAEARLIYQDALNQMLRLFDEQHPDVLRTRFELGRLALADGDRDEAETHFAAMTAALPQQEQRAPYLIGCLLADYARLLALSDQPPKTAAAGKWFKRALACLTRAVPAYHQQVIATRLALVNDHSRNGRYEQAAELLITLHNLADTNPEPFAEHREALDQAAKTLSLAWGRPLPTHTQGAL